MARLRPYFFALGCALVLTICACGTVWGQQLIPAYAKAYRLAFKLKADSARALTASVSKDPEVEAQRVFVQSLTDMITNMVREAKDPLPNYFDNQEARIDQLKSFDNPGPWAQQALIECYLHQALMQGLYGHEIKASFSFVKAYNKNHALLKKYPDFLPAQKSEALFQLVISLIPNNGAWLVHLLGFRGDRDKGIAELKKVSQVPNAQQDEATLLYSLMLMYVQRQPEAGRTLLKKYVRGENDDVLGLSFLASAQREARQNDSALATMNRARRDPGHLPYYFPLLLKGELYLNKLQTDSAIKLLSAYEAVCSPNRLLKQTNFKLFLAYYLKGDSAAANRHFYAIRTEGETGGDGDRYALYFAKRGLIPDKRLIRARLLSDGGYDAKAQATLDSIYPGSLRTITELTELGYRRARLAQRRKDTASANRLFQLTISTGQDDPSYYAPMACIQLGEHALRHQRWDEAEAYFKRARTYPEHEYKQSLDDRADADLSKLAKAKKKAKKWRAEN